MRVRFAGRRPTQRGVGQRGGLKFALTAALCLWIGFASPVQAQDDADAPRPQIELRELFEDGGAIGIVILALSVAMLALMVEHLLSIRRSALMPRGLAEEVHDLLNGGEYRRAEELCRSRPSFLARMLGAGLAEVEMGYSAVEKSMEDASTQQAARLYRKIEYLSMISTIAPMLGLLGTVWGMILAFLEFTLSANPQPAQLAPGISKALVTTLMGLGVAVPAVASFHIFRNRIDELVAEASLLAEHVFAEFKRSRLSRRKRAGGVPAPERTAPAQPMQPAPSMPPVTIERDRPA